MEPQHRRCSPTGTSSYFSWNWIGVAVFSRKPALSLKPGQIRPRLLLVTNRKSHTSFRLVPKSTSYGWPWTAITHSVSKYMHFWRPNIRKFEWRQTYTIRAMTDSNPTYALTVPQRYRRTDGRLTIAIPRFARTLRGKMVKIWFIVFFVRSLRKVVYIRYTFTAHVGRESTDEWCTPWCYSTTIRLDVVILPNRTRKFCLPFSMTCSPAFRFPVNKARWQAAINNN